METPNFIESKIKEVENHKSMVSELIDTDGFFSMSEERQFLYIELFNSLGATSRILKRLHRIAKENLPKATSSK